MESEIIIYQTQNGNTKIEVKLENETVWLSQNQMATLYQNTKQNISLHLKNIFKETTEQGSPLFKKVIQPSREEEVSNPRSRSSKLRVFVKSNETSV